VGAIGVEAGRRTGAVLPIQMSLRAAQPHRVQADGICKWLRPARPAPISVGHSDRDLARSEVERDPSVADRVTADRAPITHQLHPVGVAAINHSAHNARREHLARRDQRLNLGQFGLLFHPAPT
jgi:hypothetical protein